WKLGQKADRTDNPLRMYGLLEIGIGLSAAVVPLIFRALDSFYWAMEPSVSSIPGGGGFIRFGSSFIILLTPTFLMGGTLPVLTRFFTENLKEVERKVGLLYALNTFGAAAGTLAAALVFIPGLGNIRTTLIIATINVAIGLFAVWMSGAERERREESAAVPRLDGEQQQPNPTADRVVLLTLAVSGFAAMMY